MSEKTDWSNVGRRGFIASAGGAAAGYLTGVGNAGASEMQVSLAPTTWEIRMTCNTSTGTVTYDSCPKQNDPTNLVVRVKDKVRWRAYTSHAGHELVMIFKNETPLVDDAKKTRRYVIRGSESDETGSVSSIGKGFHIELTGSGNYEFPYSVLIIDSVTGKTCPPVDPKIIIGKGNFAEHEVEEDLEELNEELREAVNSIEYVEKRLDKWIERQKTKR